MAQTRIGSLAEALANIAVGFAINWVANMLILPLFGFAITPGAAFHMGLIFTGISLARSYVLRRWFNGLRFGNRPKAEVKIDLPRAMTVEEFKAALRARDAVPMATRIQRSIEAERAAELVRWADR